MPNDNNKQPHLVHTHDVQVDADYTQWLVELKARYRSAQIKAAVRVNAEKLLFNWQLGRDLVIKKAESRWGEGIVKQLSLDLQAEFPGDKGFGARNLYFMKQWFLYYTEGENHELLKQPVSELPYPFALIPWGHHIAIMQHSETLEDALYANVTDLLLELGNGFAFLGRQREIRYGDNSISTLTWSTIPFASQTRTPQSDFSSVAIWTKPKSSGHSRGYSLQ